MPKHSKPRAGSLQFWPRKRARKFLPRVNWLGLEEKNKDSNSKLLGFIGYKVGMATAFVKDNTEHSMTKNKKIAVPVTILEVPGIKIYSARFYKLGKVVDEVIVDNSEKFLKKAIKLSKKVRKIEDVKKDYDDVRIIAYSLVKKTNIKKKPDLTELGLSGNLEDKINFIKNNIGKEILISQILNDIKLVDIRGLTKGKGLQGPLKRFGIKLKQSKSEKGRRKPGSIGPWHPSHVLFRVPMAGQLGMFTRVSYNKNVLEIGKISEKDINPKQGWKNFGNIKTEFIILKGSVPGSAKRQMLISLPLRKNKKTEKINYEVLKLE